LAEEPSLEQSTQNDINTDLPKWKAFIKKLERAHEQGNANKLSNLYIENGRENSLSGADTILVFYAAQFRKTADRSIKYNIKSHRYGFNPNAVSAVIEGEVTSDYILIDLGKRTKTTEKFRMVLVKKNDEFKLQSYDTEALWE